jgi:hypothetical protein
MNKYIVRIMAAVIFTALIATIGGGPGREVSAFPKNAECRGQCLIPDVRPSELR